MLDRLANREDPNQTASSDLGLHCKQGRPWVCTVCLCLFGRQLVFKILNITVYNFGVVSTKAEIIH